MAKLATDLLEEGGNTEAGIGGLTVATQSPPLLPLHVPWLLAFPYGL